MSAETDRKWTDSPKLLLRAGEGFRLDDVDARSTPGYDGNKKSGRRDLKACIGELDDLKRGCSPPIMTRSRGPRSS